MNQIDLKNFTIRTDLFIDEINQTNNKKYNIKTKKINNIEVTNVKIDKINELNKKEGDYITISFEDVTDSTNKKELEVIFTNELNNLLKLTGIKDTDKCLIVGLGNINSTPDALGPLSTKKILVTKYLFDIKEVEVEKGYRNTSTIIPGVTGNTGIESFDIISGIIDKTNPDFLIVIDALASSSIERINKTIQMTNTGINPGSGVANNRKELSKETLGIPVISIGIPTVIEAITIVSDTINYLMKQISYNKDNINKNKLIPITSINYKNHENDLSSEEKEKLLGIIGNLTEEEIKKLIFEVLTPIGYNMMVTTKEIDFVVEKLSEVIANGINNSLHKIKM